jgi:transcriptional regulator with XRE-family HTH domain
VIDRLLSEFTDAWNAGERPRVDDYLARADAAERGQLAERIAEWLAIAPTPAYDDAACAALRREPALQAILAATESEAGLWPDLLPRLRTRAGLGLRELATRLAAAFELRGEADRAAVYLERMERGDLDATRVSHRLLDALGAALGVSGRELAEAGVLAPRPAGAGGALFRAEGGRGDTLAEEFEALADAARTPAPPSMDALDRLFLGGPDA